jgi:hypothetical protein
VEPDATVLVDAEANARSPAQTLWRTGNLAYLDLMF